ncbi:hypothetical protein [Entomomonas asaccharolytica]|uniref:Uncharacterized protein n=1 Tax=Entomomonas asaccharolytica TaxID=2785331 RepID=A0A974NDS1_9GAMM|nr:hypothetical protein [Entomomonas asaccharolytica]QQP84760.1 hypothetical protein JHT90_10125 [Entomomonas asaccharolytica]
MKNDKNNPIIKQLEANYKQAAAEYINEEMEVLSSLASKNNRPITIREGGKTNLILMILGMLALTIFIVHAILSAQYILMVILIIIITLISWQTIQTCRRIGKPLLTLNEQGIQLPIFDKVIYWEDIDHFYISQTQKLIFNFRIKPDLELDITQHSALKINYYPEKHHIQAIMLDFKSKKYSNYYRNLLMGYWDSGMARARLKELIE